MPLHDWTKVPAGLFHEFHQSWSIRIKDALNTGRLPKGVVALVEQRCGPREAGVLAIEQRRPLRMEESCTNGGVAVAQPPATRIVRRTRSSMNGSFSVIVFGIVLACGTLLAAAEDQPSPVAPVSIAKTTGPIQIDGLLDEPAWQKAAPIEVVYAHGKTGQRSDQPRMTAKYTWDDNYLYIGYETFDKNLVALGTGEEEGPKDHRREGAVIGHATEKVDVVEFFISFGDTHHFWEVHHNARNQFNDIWCAVVDDTPLAKTTLARFGIHFGTHEYLPDDAEAGARLATAARPKPKADGSPSTVNDASDVDTGYVGELRLPWAALGAPLAAETFVTIEPTQAGAAKKRYHGPWKMIGQELMILAVFQDGDLVDRYHHASPTLPGGWFHKGTAHWPRYRLE